MKYLVLSTLTEVFVFDVERFGINLFRWGMYSILGEICVIKYYYLLHVIILANKMTEKVVHDLRGVSDMLFHQLGIELYNAFDTMAAHVMIANWMIERKMSRAKSLHGIVRDYYGVVPNHLPKSNVLDQGTLEDQVMGAARNVMYLIPLLDIMERGLNLPVTVTCEAVMKEVENYTPEQARRIKLESQRSHTQVTKSLPLWISPKINY